MIPTWFSGHELLHAVTPGKDPPLEPRRDSPRTSPDADDTAKADHILCDLTVSPSLRSGLAWLLGAQNLARGHCAWQRDTRKRWQSANQGKTRKPSRASCIGFDDR